MNSLIIDVREAGVSSNREGALDVSLHFGTYQKGNSSSFAYRSTACTRVEYCCPCSHPAIFPWHSVARRCLVFSLQAETGNEIYQSDEFHCSGILAVPYSLLSRCA